MPQNTRSLPLLPSPSSLHFSISPSAFLSLASTIPLSISSQWSPVPGPEDPATDPVDPESPGCCLVERHTQNQCPQEELDNFTCVSAVKGFIGKPHLNQKLMGGPTEKGQMRGSPPKECGSGPGRGEIGEKVHLPSG